MKLELPRMGHRVTVCPDGLTAVAALEKEHVRLHPRRSRHAGPRRHRRHRQGQGAVARTPRRSCSPASRSLETAIAALRHGAFDYLTKPCKLIEIEALLRRVQEKRKLTQQVPRAEAAARTHRRHAAS